MRRPVTPDEMTKYKARQMSAAELKEFDANLSASGLASELRRPSPGEFISVLRPEPFDDAFDTETLLSFVKGELDAETSTRISNRRGHQPPARLPARIPRDDDLGLLPADDRSETHREDALRVTGDHSTHRD